MTVVLGPVDYGSGTSATSSWASYEPILELNGRLRGAMPYEAKPEKNSVPGVIAGDGIFKLCRSPIADCRADGPFTLERRGGGAHDGLNGVTDDRQINFAALHSERVDLAGVCDTRLGSAAR